MSNVIYLDEYRSKKTGVRKSAAPRTPKRPPEMAVREPAPTRSKRFGPDASDGVAVRTQPAFAAREATKPQTAHPSFRAVGQPLVPHACFRMAFLRAYVLSGARPRGDVLRFLNHRLLQLPDVAALAGARMYSPSTLRGWVKRHEDDRHETAAKIQRPRRRSAAPRHFDGGQL